MAKRPIGITVLGQTFKIVEIDAKRFSHAGEACDARLNTALGIIEIRDDLNDETFALVLGHEINHAGLAWTGWSQVLTALSEYLIERNPEFLEEGLCDTFSTIWKSVIHDNPSYVKMLKGGS